MSKLSTPRAEHLRHDQQHARLLPVRRLHWSLPGRSAQRWKEEMPAIVGGYSRFREFCNALDC